MKHHTRQLGPAIDAFGSCVAEPVVLDEVTALVTITDVKLFSRRIIDVEETIGFRIECTALAGGKARLEITSEAVQLAVTP